MTAPYYTDDTVTVHHGDCLDVLRGLPDASVDAVVTDPPYALPGGFMGKTWDSYDGREDAGFAYWLAGLVDGEGHFAIKQHTRGSHAPMFQLSMRLDERGTLEHIRRHLNVGTITVVKHEPNDVVRWIVQDKAGCQRLVDLFDKYPLRAKKRMDYAVWREAVCEWSSRPRGNRWHGSTDNSHMATLRGRLMDGRRYVDPPWSGHEFQDWSRLWAAECLRVLKPGGHMLAFGGTRTFHRLACAVEDAGFEIRDSIAWLYGSGFPKSLDVSKAIDRRRDDRPDIHRVCAFVAAHRVAAGLTNRQVDDHFGFNGMAGHWTNAAGPQAQVPKWAQWLTLKALLSMPDDMDDEVWRLNGRKGTPGEAWASREVIGNGKSGPASVAFAREEASIYDYTAPATDDARTWQGWGTALKPAFEPVVVGRKPLSGTVAQTVLAHGTGALNIDATRIHTAGSEAKAYTVKRLKPGATRNREGGNWRPEDGPTFEGETKAGRWPANVVLDESQAGALDEMSGERPSGSAVKGTEPSRTGESGIYGHHERVPFASHTDSGGASRFMYTAKADAGERPFIYRPTCDCEDAWPTTSPARATGATATTASSSTSKPGSGITDDASPTAIRSTMSTATSSTTTPPTSSPSPRPTTSASTPAANFATVNGGSPADSAESSSPSGQMIGISALKGGRSTDDAAPATSHAWSATSVCGNCGAPTRREAHATVKPLALMRWLVRLVCPPGGVVLEPFAGSGTTVEACILEGFRCIAIEREADYLPLITQRVNRQRDPIAYTRAAGEDLGLFELDAAP